MLGIMYSTKLWSLCFVIFLAKICIASKTDCDDDDINCKIAMEEMEPMANFKVADKRYYISTKKANWYLAQRECAMRGLRLASIPSEEHDVAILQFIHDNGFADNPFWVAGTDFGSPKNYYWISTGLGFSYSNWHKNQPDNGGGSEATEHCLEINWYKKWNDYRCMRERNFLCENVSCNIEPAVEKKAKNHQ